MDEIIINCLGRFWKDIKARNWIGRENEAVSLFVFSYLLNEIKAQSIFYDRAQIGIEVAVPQVKKNRINQKEVVRKDLVIWHKPRMTCWNNKGQPVNYPLAIIEWKFRGVHKQKKNTSSFDLRWLRDFSRIPRNRKNFVGYAINIDIVNSECKLKVIKVKNGKENDVTANIG